MLKQFFRKSYIYWVFGILGLYLGLNIFLSGFYNTIPLIFRYASTVSWLKLGLSLIATITIGVLVSFNTIMVFISYKQRKICNGKGVASLSAVGGLLVGVCPLCITGIFPLILGTLGISFSFASLPFQGLEIQAIIITMLLISLKIMTHKKNK